ncbi:hypothetical protein Leryth_003720 [Lithospermum erythrorhizon]|nr:hypothetical protein Leryth_003720 [Lithospermum erythrorhizon]
MFAQEQAVKMKGCQSLVIGDPLLKGGRGVDDTKNWSNVEMHEISGKMSRVNIGSNDDYLLSGGSNGPSRGFSSSLNMESAESNGKRVIARTSNDYFVVSGRRSQSDSGNVADRLAGNEFDNGTAEFGREIKKEMGDESFIVPFRSLSSDEVKQYGRTSIDMDSEHPSSHLKNDDISNGIRRETNYEPDALSLMPQRGAEVFPSEYDPALDYDMQITVEDNRRKGETNVKDLSKKSEKERKSKGLSGTSDKKRTGGPLKKEKPSRMNLLEDARARAEKLRSFKADIQKIKKEKEEADKKRIEALKLERQKRIAARANTSSAQKPEVTMQTKKLPSKLSPISYRGSKFSDTEPGASSPLQRSKIRTTSLGSSDSRKSSKAGKTSNNNHIEGNRHTRSVSSLSESRKESFGVVADSKASMARIRRLSEPKSSSKPVTATKARSAESVMKRKLSNGPDNKKISAIINLDKSKAATLPELKIKASHGPSKVKTVDSMAKVSIRPNGEKSSSRSLDAGACINNEKSSHDDDVDDNPIIEKAVVTLEYEKPSVTLSQQVGEKSMQIQSGDNHVTTVKSKVCAPPSPVDILDSTPAPSRMPVQSNFSKVTFDTSSAADSTREEPYLPPYARNSSLEEPCTGNSEYGKAPPVCSDMESTGKETDKAYVADVKTASVDVVPEAMDKTEVRESSKGFRRLLNFAKKSHTSATGHQSVDLDNSSAKSIELDDTKTVVGSSSEVYTLKNLISQDESPSGSGSQKSSRPFSLFAPFRAKSSEKKLTPKKEINSNVLVYRV